MRGRERGATAITVAITMVVILGIAAIAIDAGLGINERRIDQTAADVGVMAGAIEYLNGEEEIAKAALEYVWRNLPSSTGGDWETDSDFRDAFRACTDPEANSLGLSLQAVEEPVVGVWDGTGDGTGDLPCVSVSGLGYVRVRVPDQFTDTAFGAILGLDQLTTAADAVAELEGRGALGILPFGLVNGTTDGQHICLSDAPGGLAENPCDGPASGNFGTLKIKQWGDPQLGTVENCNASPVGGTLSVNIAVGVDHTIFLSSDPSDEVRDTSQNCNNKVFGINSLETDTGFPNQGTEEGLIGPLPGFAPSGSLPRLLNSSHTIPLFGVQIDDKALWEYISSAVDGDFPLPGDGMTNAPEVCDPDTFDNSLNGTGYTPPTTGWPSGVQDDWDGDGLADDFESWQHMQYCLKEYAATYDPVDPWAVLFIDDIRFSPRFSYTPEFWDSSLGSGGSAWLRVHLFRATWLQSTWWKKGNNWSVHNPGEGGCDTSRGGSCKSNESLKQLTALVIPDLSLPFELRGNPPPFGNLNPFEPLLFK